MSQWGEEPEEDRREGKEDLPDETVSAYGLWVSHAGKMGNTVGADGGGGRQGERGEGERVELPEQGDEQLVQEVLPLWRRCGADVKRWESSFIVVESMLWFCRRRRRIGDDACDGVEDGGGGDTDVESLLRPVVDRGT